VVPIDASVWVDYPRRSGAALAVELISNELAIHPFIIGELACGQLKAAGKYWFCLTHCRT